VEQRLGRAVPFPTHLKSVSKIPNFLRCRPCRLSSTGARRNVKKQRCNALLERAEQGYLLEWAPLRERALVPCGLLAKHAHKSKELLRASAPRCHHVRPPPRAFHFLPSLLARSFALLFAVLVSISFSLSFSLSSAKAGKDPPVQSAKLGRAQRLQRLAVTAAPAQPKNVNSAGITPSIQFLQLPREDVTATASPGALQSNNPPSVCLFVRRNRQQEQDQHDPRLGQANKSHNSSAAQGLP
jgi:hypothetical protein